MIRDLRNDTGVGYIVAYAYRLLGYRLLNAPLTVRVERFSVDEEGNVSGRIGLPIARFRQFIEMTGLPHNFLNQIPSAQLGDVLNDLM